MGKKEKKRKLRVDKKIQKNNKKSFVCISLKQM